MQRLGLTWAHRMASEPRRLVRRYLKWNSLFLYYVLRFGYRPSKVAFLAHHAWGDAGDGYGNPAAGINGR